MKRELFFVIAFSAISIMSCGGSNGDNPASAEEAYVMGSQFVDIATGNLPTGDSLKADEMYQQHVAYSWGPYACQTGGTFEFSGTNYYDDPSAMGSWRYAYDVSLNNCKGYDSMCGTGEEFTLNGTPTLTYEYRVDTHTYTIGFGGDYSYTGPISGTCTMDFTLVFTEVPETGVTNYSSSSGTMCGYSMEDIEAMEDSGVDYCQTLEDAIAAQ